MGGGLAEDERNVGRGGGWLRIERKGGRRGGEGRGGVRVEMSFDCGDLRGVSCWRGGEGVFL